MKPSFRHVALISIALTFLSGCGTPSSQKTSINQEEATTSPTRDKSATPDFTVKIDKAFTPETAPEPVTNSDQVSSADLEKSRQSSRVGVPIQESKKVIGATKPEPPRNKAEIAARALTFQATPYPMPSEQVIRLPSEPVNSENYAHFDDNPLKRVDCHQDAHSFHY